MIDEKSIKKHVGSVVKKYRQKNKLTQFKLGEIIDINQRQIALIESGNSLPSLPTLVNLTNTFNCDISEFFQIENYKNENQLKEILIKIIKRADYNDCKRLYTILKEFNKI